MTKLTRSFATAGISLALVGTWAIALSQPGFAKASEPAVQAYDTGCPFNAGMALDERASPLDSAQVQTPAGELKLCYGAPSLRGRVMIGGEPIPFGQLWRLGANEPTLLFTPAPILLGDVRISSGPVALYAIPGAESWEIFVSTSTSHWGNMINDEVRAQEIGRFTVASSRLDAPVERLTFAFEDRGDGTYPLVMTWQDVRLELPLRIP